MIDQLRARFNQKTRTIAFPSAAPSLPPDFQGMPVIDMASCNGGKGDNGQCRRCIDVCPTGACVVETTPVIDLGRCIFCGACARACPSGAITFTKEYRMAARSREDLRCAGEVCIRAAALDAAVRRLFGRSLKLREVSAAGCNACEADVNVLSTIVFDLGRFGIQFVASPRHADGLLITGPVSENMRLGLIKTWEALPSPRIVIVAGSCAISGGIYAGHDETHNGASSLLPVDLFIPGCPPHPLTILDGLLRMLGKGRSV